MKNPPETKTSFAKRKLWIVVGIVLLGISVVGWLVFELLFRNLAAETARPLEASLQKIGAVKQCNRSAPGRGPDNTEPWYYAIYEVPGDREEATGLVRKAASEAGYALKDGPEPGNPQDNKFYSDKTSKKSPYAKLQSGNIDLRFTVYGSSTYTGEDDQFCTITRRENPPHDKTTIRLHVNLPEYKR